ncbi:MAG: type II CRISPR RNA-guided endonuclease Cas9 [Burkholderiales bacterium]
MAVKTNGPLTIGLDIGIASVGWAVLGENRIINLGVRCFDKAETADKGESLNLARRTARLMRRRLRRRAWRLTKLARLLKREGLIANVSILKQQPSKGFKTPNLWQLRVDALDHRLAAEEWARVLYHLVKHRGFHWMSKAEEKKADEDKEGGAVKKGLAGTKKRMREKRYRTAAEMVINEFPGAQRNKRGDYSKALSRVLLADELKTLFAHQRKLGNPHAGEKLEAALLGNGDKKSGLFWAQKPALAGKDLLEMLGHCTFEKEEYRAPKASFTAERHVWLTRLNNLRIVVDGKMRPLTEAERQVALPLPYQQAGDFNYKQLRKAFTKEGLSHAFRFAGLSYPSERQQKEEKAKDPEDEKLIRLPGWQELHKTLKSAGMEHEWRQLAVAALDGKPQLLDQIAWVLSVYKEDEEVETELRKLDLPNKDKMVDALLTIRFDRFSNLSLKALYKILPHMEQGLRYDEACEKAGYHHSLPDQHDPHAKGDYLPPFYTGRDKDGRLKFNEDMDIPRNPVVLRALNQARKVVNALIKTYGPPHEVHIEMARDLSRNFDERRDIKREQDEYRKRNEEARAAFASEFNITGQVKGKQFEKYQLYREQQGKCAYSLEPLDIVRVINDEGYVEIDHALPYSRSFDDSRNNRVLVLTRENRNKGNMTPYEYLDGKSDSEHWRQFVAFVESNKAYRQAKRNRLLKKDFGENEARDFRERNLNDTRYICRFFKNYVERYLKLHEESDAKRCVVVSGQLTAFLRARWGLVKVRGDSDRHHALDAAVVAACSHSMVKRLSDYSRRKELEQVRAGFVDMETGEIVNPAMFNRLEQHFPSPWPHFRDELIARLSIDDPVALRTEMERLGYPPDALEELKLLFVSRAPQRRNSGAVHKETIYGQPAHLKAQGGVTQRVSVTDLKVTDIEKLIEPHRNEKLYAALREWVSRRDEREKRAREIEKAAKKAKRELTADEKTEIAQLRALPHKPDKNGNPTGPIVHTVTMVIDKLSGIPIRGGIAKNDTMLRVDVFTKAGKYHLVPVYVHHRVTGLPNQAIVAFKDENEWTLIDDSFQFLFSLYPNDLLQVTLKSEKWLGYYAGCDRSTGNTNLWAHDRSKAVGKDGLIRTGVKTALSLNKFNVDILGNIYPAPAEKRRDLA